jgi:hypothetical protein
MTVLVTKDLRSTFVQVRDQEQRPTCVSFAVSDAHAAARTQSEPLSVEHLFHHALAAMQGADTSDGVSLPSALTALAKHGQCNEIGWPYRSPACTEPMSPPESAKPSYTRHSAAHSPVFMNLTSALDQGRAVILVLLIGMNFMHPLKGVVDVTGQESDVAYHCVVAVGHGQVAGQSALLIRNSWGPKWGIEGHAWLSETYVNQRAYEAAVLVNEVT